MPKTSYPGTKIYSSNNYYETKVAFSTIYNNPKIKNIEKPNYQGALNINKVEKMIQEYQKNPLFIRPKNKITIGTPAQYRKWVTERQGKFDQI